MVEEIIGFSTGHDLKCVPLGDGTWTMTGGVHLYDPQKPPDLLVNDYTGSSYPTEVHCIEEIIIELHKYEFVQPPVIAESPGFSEQKRPEIQRPRAERQIPAETKPDQPYTESADTKAEPNNAERPNYTEPSKETPSGETPDQNIFEKIEGGIQEAFRPGHEGVQLMKQQLENDTDESNWIANAAIATGLDVLDFAMGMVEGIPLGILDTKNIGEGLAEGTWEGAKKDISRALNVLPQGKILKAVDRALTASDVVEAVDKGDLKEAGIAVGMAVLSVASKGKKEDKGKKKGTGALRRRKADRDALMAKSRQELGKKLGPPENYSYGKGRFATYEASKVSGMESHHMIPEALFARGPASLMGLADYVPAMPVSMLEHRGVGGQGSANLTESLNTILKDKYYGKILTRADLSRAIDEVRAYYGNLGLKEYAASVAEFRNRLFDKL